MEGCGGKGLRASQCDEQLLVQHTAWGEPVLRLQGCKALEKDGGARAGRHRIEERAEGSSARERLEAEEGRRVIGSLTVVELALGLHKRRRVHAKDAKGTAGSGL
jgi:hypothetical protein